jgi:hypothetical protein
MFRWALRKGIDNFKLERNRRARDVRDRIDASARAAWRFSRGSAALVWGFGLAAPAAAHASVQPLAASVYTMGPGRIVALVAVVVGLIGAVNGGLAVARSGRIGPGNGRRQALVALVLGPIGLVIGGVVVATAGGGVGTGHGLGGAVVAVVVGVIGMALGGLAVVRARRKSREPGTDGSSIT